MKIYPYSLRALLFPRPPFVCVFVFCLLFIYLLIIFVLFCLLACFNDDKINNSHSLRALLFPRPPFFSTLNREAGRRITTFLSGFSRLIKQTKGSLCSASWCIIKEPALGFVKADTSQTKRQTDTQTKRQTHRQTERHTQLDRELSDALRRGPSLAKKPLLGH